MSMTWGNITDDADYVAKALEELGFTCAFADLTTDQMSAVLMLASRAKRANTDFEDLGAEQAATAHEKCVLVSLNLNTEDNKMKAKKSNKGGMKIRASLYAKMVRYAKLTGVSVEDVMYEALTDYLKKDSATAERVNARILRSQGR